MAYGLRAKEFFVYMKNTTMLMFVGIIILLVGGFVFFKSIEGKDYGAANGNAINNENAQKVVIGSKNLNYYPQTIRVKAGEPVEISLDGSVTGCLRSFTIKEFGVSKYLKTPDDKVTFTPNKKGTFTFACSMGMGTGKLIVE